MINLIFGIISLSLGLVICLLPIFVNTKKPFSVLNSFPCELEINNKRMFSYLLLVFTFISGICFITDNMSINTVQVIILIILECISVISFFLMFVTPLNFYKYHLIFTTIFFMSSIGSNLGMFIDKMIYISAINGPIIFDVSIIASFIFGAIGLIQIALLFLPQLKNWSKLEKSEENGKVIYVKPKFNALAFLEWFYFYLLLIKMLVIVIMNQI